MPDDLGERSEAATPKRRQQTREEGNVAKSQDLSGAFLLLVGTLAVAGAAAWMLGEGKIMVAHVLDGDTVSDPLNADAMFDTLRYVGAGAVRLTAPVVLIAWAAAFLSHFGQIGWLFAPKSVQPKFSKLSPLKGFRRIFGLSGVVKAALDVVKVAVVVLVAFLTIRQHADRVLVLPYLALLESLVTVGMLMFDLALRLVVVLIVLGVIDYTYQRWKHAEDMKMTKQQVKDEMKDTDGDPEVKRRRLRIQQQIAMQRVNAAVPKADVVVTNPEHISIAIRYDAARMNAPVVVAKGADHLALRIRQIAIRHGIPIVERKPLARALYRHVAVGQEIPPDHYAAVAEVLAYVYRLSGRQAG